jgi:transposase/Zn ribbon nucleic-acid-binding protein
MKRFIEGADRNQATLLRECLDDWVDESNPVRVVDAFVDALDLKQLSFDGMVPEVTGRPSYHPSALLKLYIYGYLNRIQSSRRLEREAKRNLEVIWLVRRLTPDDKTIADFRKANGPAIKKVCARFVELCRQMGLLTKASQAIDGSKFKAANTYRMTSEQDGKMMRRYWTNACPNCPLQSKCTTGNERRIPRWEHEHILEAVRCGHHDSATGRPVLR